MDQVHWKYRILHDLYVGLCFLNKQDGHNYYFATDDNDGYINLIYSKKT